MAMVLKPSSVKNIREVLAQNKFAPRKSLGQNFLVDQNIQIKIVNAAEPSVLDLVLEIGPGLGALTGELITRAGQVVAVEYDRGLYSILKEVFVAAQNLTLINQDILKVDLKPVFNQYRDNDYRYKVVANLPYYITTPVLFKLLESRIPWANMVFMVQKEVGQRICAQAGTKDYGALSVICNFFGGAELIGVVPKTVFYPSPQVDSAIIRLMPGQVDWEIYPYLQRIIQAAFQQRRKTLLNALTVEGGPFSNKTELQDLLKTKGIDFNRRGETLTFTEFLSLAKELQLRLRKVSR